jgi:Dcp1-like decapping family
VSVLQLTVYYLFPSRSSRFDSSILDRADLAAETHNVLQRVSEARETVVYRQQCQMMQIDLSAKAARNLSVLKKIDSNVSEIISEASDTAIYKFDAAQKKWDRYGVQGAVFITQNIQAPFHSLIVLNKLGKFNAFNVQP